MPLRAFHGAGRALGLARHARRYAQRLIPSRRLYFPLIARDASADAARSSR